MLFADWGVELGKTEACLARLEMPAWPPQNRNQGMPLNKPPTDALTFRISAPATLSGIDPNMQQPSLR